MQVVQQVIARLDGLPPIPWVCLDRHCTRTRPPPQLVAATDGVPWPSQTWLYLVCQQWKCHPGLYTDSHLLVLLLLNACVAYHAGCRPVSTAPSSNASLMASWPTTQARGNALESLVESSLLCGFCSCCSAAAACAAAGCQFELSLCFSLVIHVHDCKLTSVCNISRSCFCYCCRCHPMTLSAGVLASSTGMVYLLEAIMTTDLTRQAGTEQALLAVLNRRALTVRCSYRRVQAVRHGVMISVDQLRMIRCTATRT